MSPFGLCPQGPDRLINGNDMTCEALRRVCSGAMGAQRKCGQLCLGVWEGFLGEEVFEQTLKVK